MAARRGTQAARSERSAKRQSSAVSRLRCDMRSRTGKPNKSKSVASSADADFEGGLTDKACLYKTSRST